MILNDLTVNFKHLNREQLLSDWVWLVGPHLLPILLTAAGDAFLQDTNDGTIHFLDVVEGTLSLVAESPTEFQTLLTDRDFVGNHFVVELIGDLIQEGRRLKPGQIYSFIHPPILGGECTLENIEPADIEVHFSLSGQIHRQAQPDTTSSG